MRSQGVFSAKRVALPSRAQVQRERERLHRTEQRFGRVLRWMAVGIAAVLLVGAVVIAVLQMQEGGRAMLPTMLLPSQL